MKKFLKKTYKDFFCYLTILLLAISPFLIRNGTIVFAATGDPPTIAIVSPAANSIVNKTKAVILGTYSDANVPASGLTFIAYDSSNDQDVKISDSASNPGDWSITNNAWTFTKTLTSGSHTITVAVEETANTANLSTAGVVFTIDTNPYITDTGILMPDNTFRSGEDLTYVPQDAKIKMTVADDSPMTQLVSKIQDTVNPYNPVKVMLGSSQISGTTAIKDLGSSSGKYSYDLTFTPDKPLAINTTYLVYLDTGVTDDANNPVYSKFFKFTTMTNAKWDDPDDQSHSSSNPHGHYQLNTNMCASCHSSHLGSNNSLDGGNYKIQFYDKLKTDPSENYCMACHDGTMNAPVIDKMNSKYHHNNPADYSATGTNNLKDPSTCTSCHNPHLEWSEQNQNLLKDHYVYTHNTGDNVTPLKADSLDKPCDSCHDNNQVVQQNTASGQYEQFAYNKSMTATGQLTDYSLCLRCHNTAKNAADSTLSDIEQYYKDPASGHNFTLPAGQTTQDDGSKLNGPIPCAECHETHGSNNIDMLRTQLGNDPNAPSFATSASTWTASDERNFCLKCHNNTTEIYGKTGEFNIANSSGTPITGHQPTDTQACSSCHGTGGTAEEKALSAAHAPKKPQ